MCSCAVKKLLTHSLLHHFLFLFVFELTLFLLFVTYNCRACEVAWTRKSLILTCLLTKHFAAAAAARLAAWVYSLLNTYLMTAEIAVHCATGTVTAWQQSV